MISLSAYFAHIGILPLLCLDNAKFCSVSSVIFQLYAFKYFNNLDIAKYLNVFNKFRLNEDNYFLLVNF